MTELILFFIAALGAVWSRGRLDTAATAAAVLIALRGVESYGWVGLAWSWQQAGAYAALTLIMAAVLGYIYRSELWFRGWKPLQDLAALVAWGTIQQTVLLGFLALINPWLAVVVFAIVHLPNLPLAAVTLVGGGASVAIALHFGAPCFLAAGLCHALLSWWIRDFLGLEMGVGRGYDGRFATYR